YQSNRKNSCDISNHDMHFLEFAKFTLTSLMTQDISDFGVLFSLWKGPNYFLE
ncbi:hypothetical protein Bhyg_09650, partial [Pseudolycoriella hygida]